MRYIVALMSIALLFTSCKYDTTSGGDGGSTYLDRLGTYTLTGEPASMALTGTTLLVLTQENRLLSLDVSNPDAVWLDANVAANGLTVTASGDIAIIADGQGFGVWNVSQSWNPELATYSSFSGASDAAINGAYAYVASTDEGLSICDISEPWFPPYEVGDVWSVSNSERIVLSNGYAYMLHPYGMYIVDVTPVETPLLMGGYAVSSPNDVAIRGSYAYIVHDFGLTVLDVSDPWSPYSVASHASYSPYTSIAITGSWAFVCGGNDELKLFDISNPNSPELIDTFYTFGTTRDVVTDGVYAYVACDGSLEVLRLDIWR